MKRALTLSRILVGLLFIFSGLVKANDPLGLAYKMQEFFDAWNWHGWNDYTLALSVTMIGFEIVAGVALLLGWQMRLFSWLLLLLILFFLFLTSYVLFSGKIKACGCFGDCIPLTPIQTFIKDIVLSLLILFLFYHRGSIRPVLPSFLSLFVLLLTVGYCVWVQAYVLRHLPFKDCLPFKAGNNLVQQMQVPADAVPDSTVMTFIYEKGGKRYTFSQDQLPANLDGYTYIDRTEKVVREGRDNEPPIKDFVLFNAAGADTTLGVLNQQGAYYILFRKDFDEHTGGPWLAEVVRIAKAARDKHIPFIIVTGQRDRADQLFNQQLHLDLPLYTCDVTAIKTAARTNPCIFSMDGPVVGKKYGFADFDEIR
ncbi:BT_3928 family protein [Dinghuibacter silviterrae]|uniref:DoxX-like protein n=1 Tax=Dinghuibacter silviterrae TaxID=1539049 RepID=A0A4R8DW36_9BACT|nr:BT_3928 family protein [Dinghuibacter silviterrae]TDX01695.1 DoxX-like protein [Dinghuibacter silviterrae]